MVSTLDPHHHLASLSEQICELSTTVDHPAWHVSIFQCPLAKFQLAKVEQTQEIEFFGPGIVSRGLWSVTKMNLLP